MKDQSVNVNWLISVCLIQNMIVECRLDTLLFGLQLKQIILEFWRSYVRMEVILILMEV